MSDTLIEQQLAELFQLEQQLRILLESEQYQQFQQQQSLLSERIKRLIDTTPVTSLTRYLEKLRELEKNIARLQSEARVCFAHLKNKSLLQRRNKSRLKAYK